jgi:hypothetical protein
MRKNQYYLNAFNQDEELNIKIEEDEDENA